MTTVSLLNYLHRNGWWYLLCRISQAAYFVKGYGYVKAVFHETFRAYEYKVRGVVYLSLGPGWAFDFGYLKRELRKSFCYQYMPGPGDCVVDIGAGLGEETVVYAMCVGTAGRVVSIEANPTTFSGLQYLCEQNNFRWVTPMQIAIYKEDTDVMIEDNHENYLINTISEGKSPAAGIPVKGLTLDTLTTNLNLERIDFLKANIEGAEQFLIQGMSQSVRIIGHLCISCHDFREIHDHDGEFYLTKKKVRAFLEASGFEVFARNTGDRVVDDYIYATRKQ